MEYTRLGATGLQVSRLCLGCMTYGDPGWREWVLDEAASRPFIREAWEAGINFFDTADMYSLGRSEEVLGRAVKELARRDEVVIATKVFNPMGRSPTQQGLSRKHVMEAIDASLKRLGTDYVDLYIIHRFDPETPIEETVEALHDVVKAGKALYLGRFLDVGLAAHEDAGRCSGRAAWPRSCRCRTTSIWSIARRSGRCCPCAGPRASPSRPGARSPAASSPAASRATGAATVRARTDTSRQALGLGSEQDHAILDRVAEVAGRLGVKPAQVALAWVLGVPGVTSPIVGASKPHHLEDALAALAFTLDAETRAYLEEPYRPRPVQGHS